MTDDTEGIEMKRKYDLAIFIGRFQPLHNGHIQNIEKALEVADHVLVILGSANQPRTIKNPFTIEERRDLIKEIYPTGRVAVRHVEDYLYQETRWVQSVQLRRSGIGLFRRCPARYPRLRFAGGC